MAGYKIRSLGGGEPHPDYRGWRGFLDTTDIRDTHDGVIFYGKNNCNYILFPTGEVLENYGYHGANRMRDIREFGWKTVLDCARTRHKERLELCELCGYKKVLGK